MVDAAAFDEVGAPATVLLEAALHVCGDADIKHAIATVQQAGVLAVHRTARLRLTIYGAIASYMLRLDRPGVGIQLKGSFAPETPPYPR